MDETAHQRSARRSRIIAQVWRDFVAEHLAAGTLHECFAGEIGTEEAAELAALTPEADAELHRRTTEALRAARF